MRPRWHKVAADLFSHKVRSLLVIASIAVGLFAIGMIATGHSILAEDIRVTYASIEPANIQISAAPFEADLVTRIGNLAGVAQAVGAWNVRLRVLAAGGEWKPVAIRAMDSADMQDQVINRVSILEGSWPPGEREIALDVNKIDDTGAGLNDFVEIKLPSGAVRKMRVAAVVRDLTIGSSGGGGGFFLAPVQGYVTSGTLAWLEQPEAFNTIYATVEQGEEDLRAIQAVADRVLGEFERQGRMTFSSVVRRSSEHPNLAYVDAMAGVIYVLGFLVVFLSGFLITNTLSALLKQQTGQIGVMKTIGASRQQIVGIYMLLILVFSLLALAIAIPPSKQAAYALLDYLAGQVNFQLQGYRTVPEATLLQVIVALVVPQAAGMYPIAQGTRISVREALSGAGRQSAEKTGLIYRLLAKVRGLSRPLLISLRNTFRRRGRLALTLITLALGGATFIATFNVRYSLESYIDQLGQYFLADVNLTMGQPYRVERVTRSVLEVPGVRAVEGWGGGMAQIVLENGEPGESVQLVAPPADSSFIQPIVLEGRWIEAGDENVLALSEGFRDRFPGLQPGDALRLRIDGDERDWIVIGFFQFAGRSTGLMAYGNYDYIARKTGMAGRSAYFRIMADEEDLSLAGQEELGSRLEAHLSGLGYEISEATAGLSLQETTSRGLNVLTIFLLIMSLLMASVGSIGLAGSMSLNVMERTREIGVMRAIGGSNRAIVQIVLVEGILNGLISWLLACLAAVPISKLLADTIFQIIFMRGAALAMNFTGNLIWLGMVVLLSILASVIPAYNASRLTIREVLAYE